MMARALVAGLVLLLVSAAPARPACADTIDDYLRTEMQKRRIPGLALAVVRDGAVVRMQGYGFANLEHDVPVTPDTIFELASVTKQFTATAIMRLVEDGKVGLDDTIGRHLSGAPETWKAITVRHLLTHTSGLPGLEDNFKALRPGGLRVNYTTAQLYDAATKDTLSFPAGERFQYSDAGYFLLGMIVESASGQRYREFLDERFFRPLGMTSTSVLDQWRILKHRAAGYTILDDQLVNIRRVAQIELPSHYGVFSSVKDLVTWDGALAAGRVVKPATLAELWTPVKLNDGARYPYGFGWFVEERRGHRWITHTGITGTEYSRFPDDGLTVIVLTNLGRRIGARSDVNSWGLTYGVAGRYISGLLVGTQPAEPDSDPAATQRLRDILNSLARGEEVPEVVPKLRAVITPPFREVLSDRLRTLQSFTFMACDDARTRSLERYGAPVSRVCHYRMINATETRYYSLWLTAEGRVADIWSSTE
jgi:CubicO group peptidase (beta-lactamase class C family)